MNDNSQKKHFVCIKCGSSFSILISTLNKYPGWQPKICLKCKNPSTKKFSREENLTTAQVLEKYSAGPQEGVFTDGAAEPNPGPGGWGVVYVKDNKIIKELCGHEPYTTNNRMELLALIRACEMVPVGTSATLFSDSQLCVKTINLWAARWASKGWKRKKNAEVKNLELVQELYQLLKSRPELRLEWIEGHAGNRWNEYADSLATSWRQVHQTWPLVFTSAWGLRLAAYGWRALTNLPHRLKVPPASGAQAPPLLFISHPSIYSCLPPRLVPHSSEGATGEAPKARRGRPARKGR